MNISSKKILIFTPLFLSLTIAIISFFPFKQVIAFTFEDKEELLSFMIIKEDETFQIKYTHSIHLSDVTETYHLSDKKIILKELAYEDFSIGMPSNAEGNEVFEEKDGTYYIKHMNRSFRFIDMRVGKVKANHRIIYKGRTYELTAFIKPGSWVRISPKKITLWELLKGVNING